MEKKLKGKALRRFACAGACLLLALFFKFFLAGYGFAALFFLLLALAAGLYGVLHLLEARRPETAKGLRVFLTAAVCVCTAALIAVEVPIVLAARGDGAAEADYLIVLGAGVDGRKPSRSLEDRLEAALDYLEAHPGARCIVSGGQGPGEEITEAACMYAWLTDRGVEPGRILREERALNTAENLKYSLALIEEDGATVAVLTSEYHLYRAQYLARQMGVETLGIPAKTGLPVLMLSQYFREAFAVVRLWLFGWT